MSLDLMTNQDTLNKTFSGIPPFSDRLAKTGLLPLRSTGISTLQVNLGKVCNQSCRHCHVGAGPERKESMGLENISLCLEVLRTTEIPTLDITGGAPELNPGFPWLVDEAVKLGRRVIVRTNLTVLDLPDYSYLAEFYATREVELFSSLPCYLEQNIDQQRGAGVFQPSIRVLKRLNALGYGRENGPLRLNLVFNPGGAFLPPPQHSLEEDFRRELLGRYGLIFSNLYTITNVPIGRFLDTLINEGQLDKYLEQLANAFNTSAAARVMCRDMISVGWDGRLYDCDFNQMLGLTCEQGVPGHIRDFDLAALQSRPIVLGNHCYACTAGAGSSCCGIVADEPF